MITSNIEILKPVSKNKNTSTEPVVINNKGLVLYSDGGSRGALGLNPNPGCIGWGVHGYVFEDTVAKKGAGISGYLVGKSGYIIKGESNTKDQSVKPLLYVDGYGSSTQLASNNVAELNGARFALIKAQELCALHTPQTGSIATVVLYTDSKYVVGGINEWSNIWIARNWIKTDGSPVPNKAEWLLLLEAHKKLKELCPNVKVEWVKGHGDSLGNNTADKLATTAVMYSLSKIEKIDFTVTSPDGYWKTEPAKHPFLAHKRIYFNTLYSANLTGEYYMGDHGPDSYYHGKRMADNSYSLIQLATPEPAIECIKDKFCIEADGRNSIIIVDAALLFSPEVHNDMLEHGSRIIPFYKKGMTALTLSGKPLTEEQNPPGLSYRGVESMVLLDSILKAYKTNDLTNTMVDITDEFYEKEIKKKKNEEIVALKLKPQFVVGIRALPYKLTMVSEKGKICLPLTLTFGIDMPERNVFKQLETLEPKVTLIAWQDSPDVVRYATVIESQGSFSAWCGIHSNLVIITPDKLLPT
jgi:ribonuclease HI